MTENKWVTGVRTPTSGVFFSCAPEAQRRIHQVLGSLLQFGGGTLQLSRASFGYFMLLQENHMNLNQ